MATNDPTFPARPAPGQRRLHLVGVKLDSDDLALLDELRADMQLHSLFVVDRGRAIKHCLRQLHILTFGQRITEKAPEVQPTPLETAIEKIKAEEAGKAPAKPKRQRKSKGGKS